MKHKQPFTPITIGIQPPSGGCVLKRLLRLGCPIRAHSAAFGRLCVETMFKLLCAVPHPQPPSGGCVLKLRCRTGGGVLRQTQPPSGGCVLKRRRKHQGQYPIYSAAFGRLCVETFGALAAKLCAKGQPPLGGCVLKLSYVPNLAPR